jgi:hypothetical protein
LSALVGGRSSRCKWSPLDRPGSKARSAASEARQRPIRPRMCRKRPSPRNGPPAASQVRVPVCASRRGGGPAFGTTRRHAHRQAASAAPLPDSSAGLTPSRPGRRPKVHMHSGHAAPANGHGGSCARSCLVEGAQKFDPKLFGDPLAHFDGTRDRLIIPPEKSSGGP